MGKKRSSISENDELPSDSKRVAFRAVVEAAGQQCPKTKLANVLLALHEKGFLDSRLLAVTETGDHCDERTARRYLQTAAAEPGEVKTPYGKVVESMLLPQNSEDFRWKYVNPFAFLHHACNVSDNFASLVDHFLGGVDSGIIIYFDETRPGNVLRPDPARMVLSIYWTFRELPEFLRHRVLGWFPFGFIRTKKVNEIPGGMSNLAARILRVFWNRTGFNFSVGCRCVIEEKDVFIKAGLFGFLGDEKAIKEILNVKGSSGSKPCKDCKNIVSKHFHDVAFHPYFAGLDCCHYALLDKHSNESFYDMVKLLITQKNNMTQTRFGELQKALGINFCTDSLLFQDDLQHLVRPINGVYWDWMHVLVSHGLADVELGLFIAAITNEGIRIQQLEMFAGQFKGIPGGKFPKDFVTKRLKTDGEAFKGFSSELLSFLPIVMTFAEMVLKPKSLCVDEVACFDKLCEIVALMSAGDAACRYTAHLRSIIEEHHVLFIKCYGSSKATPKFHYCMHLPDVLEALQINASCFTTERKHRLSKKMAARVFANFEDVLLQDFLCETMAQFKLGDDFLLERLGKDLEVCDETILEAFQEVFPEMTAVYTCTSATLVVGLIHKQDVVLLQAESPDGEQIVCEVLAFFKIVCRDSDDFRFMVHVNTFEEIASAKWKPCLDGAKVYEASCVKCVLTYAPLEGDVIRIVEPYFVPC